MMDNELDFLSGLGCAAAIYAEKNDLKKIKPFYDKAIVKYPSGLGLDTGAMWRGLESTYPNLTRRYSGKVAQLPWGGSHDKVFVALNANT